MSDLEAQKLVREGCGYLDRWRNTRSEEDRDLFLKAKGLFERASEASPDWERPLLLLAYMLYRIEGEGSFDLLHVSRRGLRLKANADFTEYFFKSVFRLYSNENDLSRAAECFSEIAPYVALDPDSETLFKIYDAIFQYKQNNFSLYCAIIRSVLDDKKTNKNLYVVRQAATSSTLNSIPGCDRLPFGVSLQLGSIPSTPSAIASVSCERGYFERFGSFLFSSFARHSRDDEVLHVGCVCSSADTEAFLSAVREQARVCGISDRVGVSLLLVESPVNVKPLASLARLIMASRLRRVISCPVVSVDFDAAFTAPIQGLVALAGGADVGFRVRKGSAPWERFTAGATVFSPSKGASEFLGLVESYALGTLRTDVEQWWIDQNCLEAAWRHCATQGPAVRFVDVEHSLSELIALPTGPEEVKLAHLGRST